MIKLSENIKANINILVIDDKTILRHECVSFWDSEEYLFGMEPTNEIHLGLPFSYSLVMIEKLTKERWHVSLQSYSCDIKSIAVHEGTRFRVEYLKDDYNEVFYYTLGDYGDEVLLAEFQVQTSMNNVIMYEHIWMSDIFIMDGDTWEYCDNLKKLDWKELHRINPQWTGNITRDMYNDITIVAKK